MVSFTIAWYFENKETIDNILGLTSLAALVAALWLGSQLSLDLPSPFNLLVMIVTAIPIAIAYIAVKMWIRRCFSSSVRQYSSRFRGQPEFRERELEKSWSTVLM